MDCIAKLQKCWLTISYLMWNTSFCVPKIAQGSFNVAQGSFIAEGIQLHIAKLRNLHSNILAFDLIELQCLNEHRFIHTYINAVLIAHKEVMHLTYLLVTRYGILCGVYNINKWR